jgi:hypothetical protein
MTELLCPRCGAPWDPDLTGACRFCRVAPPGIGGRPNIDADALGRVLWSTTADPSHPLDALVADLRRVAGNRVTASGDPVARLELTLDDWRYEAAVDHGDVAAQAVHTVRSVVLKHQALPFDEWVACVAGHLAEFAATHRHVYDAIVALDRA